MCRDSLREAKSASSVTRERRDKADGDEAVDETGEDDEDDDVDDVVADEGCVCEGGENAASRSGAEGVKAVFRKNTTFGGAVRMRISTDSRSNDNMEEEVVVEEDSDSFSGTSM